MSGRQRIRSEKYSKLTIGVPRPVGVWFPDDSKQMEPSGTWREMAEAGFEVSRPARPALPDRPRELQKWCDEYGMRVVAGTGWGVLHKQEARDDTRDLPRHRRDPCRRRRQVHRPPAPALPRRPRPEVDRPRAERRRLEAHVEHAQRPGARYSWMSTGSRWSSTRAATPHRDAGEARIFDATDPTYVNLCSTPGTSSTAATPSSCAKYPERIAYVTLRPSAGAITRQALEKDWPFGEAVTKAPRSRHRPACRRRTPSMTPWPTRQAHLRHHRAGLLFLRPRPSPSPMPSTCAPTSANYGLGWPDLCSTTSLMFVSSHSRRRDT